MTDLIKRTSREKARYIYHQLGGNRFAVMTGTKQFSVVKNGLSMVLARNSSGANFLEISTMGNNIYKMVFAKQVQPCPANGFRQEYRHMKTIDNILWENLQDIFETETELYI